MQQARSLVTDNPCLEVGYYADGLISGLPFDDPDMPDVSLSPVMSIIGVLDDEVEEVEDD